MLRVTLISGSFGDGLCGVGDYTYALARQLSNYVRLTVLAPAGFLSSNNTAVPLDVSSDVVCDPKSNVELVPFVSNNASTTVSDVHNWIKQNSNFEPSSHHTVEGTFEFLPVNSFSMFHLSNLTNLIKATNPDIVHIQYPSKGYKRTMGIEFLPLRFDSMVETIKLVTTIHEYSSAHWLRKAAIYPMASLSHQIITSTDQLAKDLSYYRNSKVNVIPVGNNFEFETPSSANNSAAVNRIINGDPIPCSLLHFGFVTRGKGIENLLFALAIARLKVPNLKLYLASNLYPRNSYHQKIIKIIDQLNLLPWIEILGEQPVSVLKAIAPKFSYQIFPFDDGLSDRRSSTISALELAAPIITTSASKEYPLLSTEPMNPEKLSELLVSAVSQEICKERISLLYAQSMLKSFYSFNRIAQEHLKLYQEIT